MDAHRLVTLLAVAGLTFFSGLPRAAFGQVQSARVELFVLDDCDQAYEGKAKYEDNLSFIGASGKLQGGVTGLNICQEIGSPHRITVDARRKRIWVSETVGARLLAYDLAGNQTLSVPNIRASALAVDTATGNLWVARSAGQIGKGSTEVFDRQGRSLAVHDFFGYDIIYDAKEKSVWLVERELLKVSLDGKVLVRKHIANWCAVSIAINPRTGTVWVVTRKHSQANGTNQLLAFDTTGKLLHTISLGERIPLKVAVDERDGTVWVTDWRKALLRFSADGKLEAELQIPALAAEVAAAPGRIWVATRDEILKVTSDGTVLSRTKHRAETSQAWLATYSATRELSPVTPSLRLSDKEMAELWAKLADTDFDQADSAWHKLGAAGDNASEFFREKIRSIAVPKVDTKRIEKLVLDLDSDRFAIRENALKELEASGEMAVRSLQRLVAKPRSLEGQLRATLLLKKWIEPKLTPERSRALAAIELLEELRTAKAIALLQEIEREALVPSIGSEARLALDRLKLSGKIKQTD